MWEQFTSESTGPDQSFFLDKLKGHDNPVLRNTRLIDYGTAQFPIFSRDSPLEAPVIQEDLFRLLD